MRTARDAVDHLLLGTRDLDEGIAWLEARTGVRAAPGGRHPGWGTENALASLGPGQYLEILAPDPSQETFAFPIDVRGLEAPRLVGWAASARDAAALAAHASTGGLTASGPLAGARTRPDGSSLSWRTVWIEGGGAAPRLSQAFPFFIEWGRDGRHPSSDAPHGCHLLTFDLHDPDPDRLARLLASLGIEASVAQSSTAGLVATLDTPRGRVTI